MEYIFKKSRSRIFLSFDLNNNLVFHSPRRFSEKEIQKLLEEKKDWITKTINRRNSSVKPFSLTDGSKIILFGKVFIVSYQQVAAIFVKEDTMFIPERFCSSPQKEVTSYIKNKAGVFLAERLFNLEENFSFPHHNFRLSNARSYWGQFAGAKKQISLCWRLLFYDSNVIDYVILHELCHSLQANHSKEFWKELALRCPNFKENRCVLKKNTYMHLL